MRERAAGCYSALAYMTTKFLCEVLPLRITPIAIASFIFTFGIGLNENPINLFIFFMTLILTSLTSVMLFLVIGMTFRSSGVANFMAIIAALFCLLMSGFLNINFGYLSDSPNDSSESSSATTDVDDLGDLTGKYNDDQPQQVVSVRVIAFVLSYLSYLAPSFEILMVNELNQLSFDVSLVDENGQETSTQSIGISGTLILAQLGLNASNLVGDFILLTMWLAIYFLLANILLAFKVVENR